MKVNILHHDIKNRSRSQNVGEAQVLLRYLPTKKGLNKFFLKKSH